MGVARDLHHRCIYYYYYYYYYHYQLASPISLQSFHLFVSYIEDEEKVKKLKIQKEEVGSTGGTTMK